MADTSLVELFTDIADAIRTQEESEEDISALDFPQRILDLVGGGGINFSYEEYTPSTTESLGTNQTFYHYFGEKASILMIFSPYDAWSENETEASEGYGLETLLIFRNAKNSSFYFLTRRQLNGAVRATSFTKNNTSYDFNDNYTRLIGGISSARLISNRTYRVIQIGDIFGDVETIDEE